MGKAVILVLLPIALKRRSVNGGLTNSVITLQEQMEQKKQKKAIANIQGKNLSAKS